MRKKLVIVAILFVIVTTAVMIVSQRTKTKFIQPTATFLGYTNSPTGTPLGRFRIINSSRTGITRMSYCRLETTAQEIEAVRVPRNKLKAGSSEVVEVPLTNKTGIALTNAHSITFNGYRDLNVVEGVAYGARKLLQKVGFSSKPLEVEDSGAWQAHAQIELE